MADKTADLAGPGIGTYAEVERALPRDHQAILDPKDTQIALAKAKRFIEDGLNRELNLIRVEVPLIVSKESGVNDYLIAMGRARPSTSSADWDSTSRSRHRSCRRRRNGSAWP